MGKTNDSLKQDSGYGHRIRRAHGLLDLTGLGALSFSYTYMEKKMRNIEITSSGERAIVIIDGSRIAARSSITIKDGVITVDGNVQGIIYGDAVVLVKSGDVKISPA